MRGAIVVLLAAAVACGGTDPRATPAGTSASAAGAATPPAAIAAPPAALVSPSAAALAVAAPAHFTLALTTSKGDVEIAIDRALAPRGVDRLFYLASNGFFSGARFFRVVHDFGAQFGLSSIPAVDQAFDSLPIKDDPRKLSNTRGTLVFAAHGPNTRRTQLFINTGDNSRRLDREGFAPLGRVVRGMEAVDALEANYGDAPNVQGRILSRGNDFFRVKFPDLDSIVKATVKTK